MKTLYIVSLFALAIGFIYFGVTDEIIGLSIVTILIVGFSIWRNYIIATRNFSSETFLKLDKYSINWVVFVTGIIFILLSMWNKNTQVIFLFSGGITFLLEIIDWYFIKRYNYTTSMIIGNTLFTNDFKIKKYDLEEMTMVNFIALGDILSLQFRSGSSAQFYRPQYDKEKLNLFVLEAIGKSKLFVVISDEAKAKINIS